MPDIDPELWVLVHLGADQQEREKALVRTNDERVDWAIFLAAHHLLWPALERHFAHPPWELTKLFHIAPVDRGSVKENWVLDDVADFLDAMEALSGNPFKPVVRDWAGYFRGEFDEMSRNRYLVEGVIDSTIEAVHRWFGSDHSAFWDWFTYELGRSKGFAATDPPAEVPEEPAL